MRSGKQITVHNPVLFLAQDRELAEEAFPGDIIGIPNHGTLRIGDTLTEGEELRFTGIPTLRAGAAAEGAARRSDAAKHLGKALTQLAEEGAAQVFRTAPRRATGSSASSARCSSTCWPTASAPSTSCRSPSSRTSLFTARWVEADDRRPEEFRRRRGGGGRRRLTGLPVFLAANAYRLEVARKTGPRSAS